MALTRAKNWLYVCFPQRYNGRGPALNGKHGYAHPKVYLENTAVTTTKGVPCSGLSDTRDKSSSRSVPRRCLLRGSIRPDSRRAPTVSTPPDFPLLGRSTSIGCNLAQQPQQLAADFQLGIHLKATRRGRPCRVAAQFVLLQRRQIAPEPVGHVDIEVRLQRAILADRRGSDPKTWQQC